MALRAYNEQSKNGNTQPQPVEELKPYDYAEETPLQKTDWDYQNLFGNIPPQEQPELRLPKQATSHLAMGLNRHRPEEIRLDVSTANIEEEQPRVQPRPKPTPLAANVRREQEAADKQKVSFEFIRHIATAIKSNLNAPALWVPTGVSVPRAELLELSPSHPVIEQWSEIEANERARNVARDAITKKLKEHNIDAEAPYSVALVDGVGDAAETINEAEGVMLDKTPLLTPRERKNIGPNVSEAQRLVGERAANEAIEKHVRPKNYEESVKQAVELFGLTWGDDIKTILEDRRYELTDSGALKIQMRQERKGKPPLGGPALKNNAEETVASIDTYRVQDDVVGGGVLVTVRNADLSLQEERPNRYDLGAISLTPDGMNVSHEGNDSRLNETREIVHDPERSDADKVASLRQVLSVFDHRTPYETAMDNQRRLGIAGWNVIDAPTAKLSIERQSSSAEEDE